MPATDGLQPSLTDAERMVVKSYGGWTPFMQSMGLKPWDENDVETGKSIAASFATGDKEEKRQAESNNASGSKAK